VPHRKPLETNVGVLNKFAAMDFPFHMALSAEWLSSSGGGVRRPFLVGQALRRNSQDQRLKCRILSPLVVVDRVQVGWFGPRQSRRG
jgi:hypothetical protein